ncbi:hypothetical protein PoB_004638200 [Plakobranchus ocellatus]|uniref:Uncharacterized protein n=1 Tax=Plakobranchus ocellatus TaxID=259542 RepID=A0AAV4BLT1_9GAST|nr:hypothetical protein PoB_004638200 [Plakobranchus ocellatus]
MVLVLIMISALGVPVLITDPALQDSNSNHVPSQRDPDSNLDSQTKGFWYYSWSQSKVYRVLLLINVPALENNACNHNPTFRGF